MASELKIGTRFGKVIVSGPAARKYHSKIKCDCGLEKEVDNGALKRGDIKSCGCRKGFRSSRQLPPGVAALNFLRNAYKYHAKCRHLKWLLSKKRFEELVLSPCEYCGSGFKPSRYKIGPKINVTGIDRVDSSKGYTRSNCVSCCSRCNKMKHLLSREEFLEAVRQIAKYQERKMAATQTPVLTVTCDNPECGRSTSFAQTPDGEAQAIKDNPWLTSARFVNTLDKRQFVYCSDECEIKQAGAGNHNKANIVVPTGPNAVDLAVQAAQRAKQATEALKSGGPVTLG